jgi:hypothetical protein
VSDAALADLGELKGYGRADLEMFSGAADQVLYQESAHDV